MKKATLRSLQFFGVIFLIMTGYVACNVEYQALKKFYPNLTFYDYFILGDKLRITPGD